MPIFGNNVVAPGTGYLDDALWGHFHAAFMPSWGMPVPACVVTAVHVYANGSIVAENAVLQFGIYDGRVGGYNTWPLFATTPTVTVPSGAPAQWWTVAVNIPLPPGQFALSILDVNGPVMTWSAGIHFTVKIAGMSDKAAVGGVFPNPLGICVATTLNYCLYADYTPTGAFTPTAACQAQQNCGCCGE
jgi:hypothetical protein